MSIKNRITAVLAIVLIAVLAVIVAQTDLPAGKQQEEEVGRIENKGKETIFIWYTDEALTSYISSAAVTYGEDRDVRVIPVLESGLEYLENINKASINGECPDLYVIGHDSLEKAYLAGLASEVKEAGNTALSDAYPRVALSAMTYQDKILGYPFYFETSSLLYNKTYLEDMAKAQLEAEADEAAALSAASELEENGPEENVETIAEEHVITSEEIEARAAQLLPETIEDIKAFADTYDAPEQVEAVFKWDVSDIFYNYFFVGNTMIVGGDSGDDTGNIDIYNLNAIKSMKAYQELNQFFAIDTKEVRYDDILEDFIAGKIVFTVATTDAVFKLESVREDGLFAYEYGITKTPDINADTPTRSLSMTNCVVVNGYSERQEAANDFAYYLTTEYADSLFARSGKAASAKGIAYGYENLNHFADEYQQSIPLPKMIETSNFWVQLEIAFAQIWDGANVNNQLKQLSEQIMTQVTGEPYVEELIEEPEEEMEEIEYLDEEYYKQEALKE